MALAPREGRRPERHQPIADKLVDNAVAGVDGRRHFRKVGVKQLDQGRGGYSPREKSMRNSFGLRWLATLGLALSRPLRCQAARLTVHGAWLSPALRHQTEPRHTGGISPRRCGMDRSWVNTTSPVTSLREP